MIKNANKFNFTFWNISTDKRITVHFPDWKVTTWSCRGRGKGERGAAQRQTHPYAVCTLQGLLLLGVWLDHRTPGGCHIDNDSALVPVMAWHWRGDKPWPEPMITEVCDVIRSQWVKNKNESGDSIILSKAIMKTRISGLILPGRKSQLWNIIVGQLYKFKINIYLPDYTLRPRQNGRHFSDDIFKCIFSNENVWIPIKISLKFVPRGLINNVPALVHIIAWRRTGDKPLSEAMMA